MRAEFRRELARRSFEEKIGKVGDLIQLSRNVKSQARGEDIQEERFNGAELSESVLGRDWNLAEEDTAWSNL